MPLGRSDRTRHGGADAIARNRVRFLTDEPIEAGRVRDSILASWWRSRRFDVAADRIRLPYVRDPNLETPLARSADPVLRSFAEQVDGQPISIVLTDASGLVLSRLTADRELERHLDRVLLAPGFSYAEEFVGTNGIGTALESGGAMNVFGHEHFAENLEDLACAGVPIAHPITGKIVGALDLTCWRRDAGPLLMTLAKTTTEQIRQALLTDTGLREIELLHEYLRVCHRSNGIVIAINNDVVMMNDYARAVLDPADQDALLRRVTDSLSTGHRCVDLELPTGKNARITTHPVHGGGRVAGIVIQVRLGGVDEAVDEHPGGGPAGMLLPGLVGSGPLWRRACSEVEALCRDRAWVAVEGEPGVGKAALLRAAHQRQHPTGRLTTIDLADVGGDWLADIRRPLLEPGTSVVLEHVDKLDPVRVRAVTAALQEAANDVRTARDWVAVTLLSGTRSAEVNKLLELFGRSVEVPPLRHHVEDVPRLVTFLLARLGYGGRLSCSPEALQLLSRASWPGNADQMIDVLRHVVQHRRTGVIAQTDLPPELLTVSRRTLSPLEAIERDAIVRSLLDARDNKAEAARALGMSRATIYRKIHEYGIVASRGTESTPPAPRSRRSTSRS